MSKRMSVWTKKHEEMYIIWKDLDVQREKHAKGHPLQSRYKCPQCCFLNSIVLSIIDYMDSL